MTLKSVSKLCNLMAMLLAFAHSALAQDPSVVQQALFNNVNVFDGKSEKLAMVRYVLIDANPIEDLLLLTNKNKIPVIMKDGKIYKNTISKLTTKRKTLNTQGN